MTKKTHSFIVLFIVVIVLALVFLLSSRFTDFSPGLYGNEEWITNTITGLDLALQYRKSPDGYILISQTPEEKGVVHYLLYKESEYQDLQNATQPREGPPVLSITAIPIEEEGRDNILELFIKTNPLSGYMEGVSELEHAVVGGEEAYRYRADGLYPADVTAVKHRSVVYIFYAMYLSPEESRRADFERVVESVSFVE